MSTPKKTLKRHLDEEEDIPEIGRISGSILQKTRGINQWEEPVAYQKAFNLPAHRAPQG